MSKHKIKKPKYRSGVAVASRVRGGAGFHSQRGYSRKVKHRSKEVT